MTKGEIIMLGLEFIAKTFNKPLKDVASEVGVSKQTVKDWVKGRNWIADK